jgi:transposase-like protein
MGRDTIEVTLLIRIANIIKNVFKELFRQVIDFSKSTPNSLFNAKLQYFFTKKINRKYSDKREKIRHNLALLWAYYGHIMGILCKLFDIHQDA